MSYFPETIQRMPTYPIIFARLGQSTATTTLAVAVAVDDTTINVTSSTGMSVGDNIFIIHQTLPIVESFIILTIATNAIGIDTPSGNAFSIGDDVGTSNVDLAVNGSVTPVKFNLKTGIPEGNFDIYITRMLISMGTATLPVLTDFGDITSGLTNGIYFRKTDGNIITYFNIKTNQDLADLAYDIDFLASTGDDGLKCRLSFDKTGSIIKLASGEDLEMWVQDDLTGLNRFTVMLEGYLVP